MNICRYTENKKQEWDKFIEDSKNGTFLFLRDYMDYHSDRFKDHSLMYYKPLSNSPEGEGKLIAVLPANERNGILYSHQGLTYGGFVLCDKAHAMEVGELFDTTISYLRQHGFKEWHYKQMPTIYHKHPSEDDEYWLWMHKAELTDCSLMTAIPLVEHLGNISPSKRNNSNRLLKQGYTICFDAPISTFWPILTSNLKTRFNASPVHSYNEIMLLQSRFPEKIKCCTVSSPEGEVLAGTILYFTEQVVKAQYTSASPRGKADKVLDCLILEILQKAKQDNALRYFDFGTSMLADSTELNEGLVAQKEGFGGRGIACKTYKLDIKDIDK